MTRHYSLDSLRVRERRIFGWGFCLDPSVPLTEGRLVVQLADGREHAIALLPGGYREDLVAAYPDVPHAGASGFMVQAKLPDRIAAGVARLEYLTPSGDGVVLSLPRFPDAYAPPEAIRLGDMAHRFRQVWGERGLVAALRAVARGAGRRFAAIRRRRDESPSPTADAVIVLDHGMGGGANRYREERVRALRGDAPVVVLATPAVATLDYRVTRWSAEGAQEASMDSQPALLAFLEALGASTIEVNSLVGFDDVEAVLAWLARWRRGHSDRRLRLNVHDFHAVCPAFTLVDAGGRFCRIPSMEVCRRCLPANAMSTLGLDTDRDPAAWRYSWSEVMALADDIVTFSPSSKALLTQAHGGVGADAMRIVPHAEGGAGVRAVRVAPRTPPVVAVVGHINRAKGAELLRAMAAASAARGTPLTFTVLGTLEGGAGPSGALDVRGSYTRETLADRIEAEGAMLAFLPSICPETYSYVTDELMATGLPLAVLDRGAPAERVARYHRGRVLEGDAPGPLLDQLVDFAMALRAGDSKESPR